MAAASNLWENRLVDGILRRGVSAWTASQTGVAVGMMRYGSTANAYGKVMVCTAITTGTCGGTEPTWPAVNDAAPNTVTDSGVTWTIYAIGMYSPPMYLGLLSAITDVDVPTVTETTGTSYARQAVHPNGTTWQSTNAATTFPSSGTNGTTQNNSAVTFPAAGSGGWGTVVGVGIYDAPTGGNLLYAASVSSQAVAAGNVVSFNAGAIQIQVDN